MSKDRVKVSVCPVCRSTDVGYIFTLGNLFGVIPRMKCKKCDHTASIFPLYVLNKKQLKKSKKKSKKGKKKGGRK